LPHTRGQRNLSAAKISASFAGKIDTSNAIAVLVSFGIDLQKRSQHAPVQPKVQPNGGNLDFLRNQSQRKKRKRTVDNLSRLELGNAVLLGKFSDELEKETNCNQSDSKATAPTHEPRMPDRSP
jgi:hypothetical protein